jgi:pimeloyl-ACP methyl ester carboxylesterase
LTSAGGERVLLVHGLWMTGVEAALLRHRLERAGYAPETYHYPTLLGALAPVLAALAERVRALAGPERRKVHLVGHSLGGVLLLRLLEAEPELAIGRLVLLGAPVNGSAAARGFAALPGSALLLGGFAREELLAPARGNYRGPAEVGVIAGTLSVGLGRVVGGLDGPNDGTVTVEEARLAGARALLELRVSHMGLLMSKAVAANIAAFLAGGAFLARP